MFDANMRHLPKDLVFFAQVSYLPENHKLNEIGIENDQIVKCKMLDESDDNPSVLFYNNGNVDIVASDEDGFGSMFVYLGNTIDMDFIHKSEELKALEILEKESLHNLRINVMNYK